MVVLLESQLKEMNPNLESISEYAFFLLTNILVLPFRMLPFLRLFCMVGIERKCPCTMNAWKSLILLLSNVMRLRSDMMNWGRRGETSFPSIIMLWHINTTLYLLLVFNFRLDEFMAGYNAISLKLKEMYQVCCFLSSLLSRCHELYFLSFPHLA